MSRHEPQLAAAIEPRRDDIEDFLRVEDFAYGVEQAYSTDRWSLVGEAGAFADPFYSPGSDFIGYGNTFTTDLITRDLDGEDIAERTDVLQRPVPAGVRARDVQVRGPLRDDGPTRGDVAQAHVGQPRSTTTRRPSSSSRAGSRTTTS